MIEIEIAESVGIERRGVHGSPPNDPSGQRFV